MELPFANQVADGGGGDHDFQRGDAASGFLLEQRLRDDRFQRFRQLGADLCLLGRRKGVDDAVDGFRRAGGVQGAEDQVPGLCGRQRELNRFEIAHFADEDDIGILAERGLAAHWRRTAYERRARAGSPDIFSIYERTRSGLRW